MMMMAVVMMKKMMKKMVKKMMLMMKSKVSIRIRGKCGTWENRDETSYHFAHNEVTHSLTPMKEGLETKYRPTTVE